MSCLLKGRLSVHLPLSYLQAEPPADPSFIDMSSQTSYPHESLQFAQYPPQRNQFHQEEFKGSYDDLIDEYVSPYEANSRHQTFAVGTPAIGTADQHRGPQFPPSKHPSFSTKNSDDTSRDPPSVAYPPLPPIKEVDTRGFWQKILPESLACRLYVITVLVETTIDLAIEGELLARVNNVRNLHEDKDDNQDNRMASLKMPVYLSIFALAHVFQFVMAVDAVYARNTLQFICLTVFNALFLVYAIIQINEISKTLADATVGGISNIPIGVLTTIIPVVISVSELAYIGLGWKIYHEFGWKVYKFLGADRTVKKMYANYQIFECLVKFDVFFWAGFSVQFIWLVLQRNDWEYYVTCAALPLSIILLVEGHLAARYENKWMMATFMSGCVGALVYFIFKLVKVLIYRDQNQFKLVYKSLSVFSVISIALLIATFVFSIIVMRNFGRGLKESMERRTVPKHSRYRSQNPHQRVATTNPNRMSID
jgi:hypothetical protein